MSDLKGKYILLSEAHYAREELKGREFVDDLSIITKKDDGTEFETVVEFYEVSTVGIIPCLKLFDDTWKDFLECPELCNMFRTIANKALTPLEFCDLLDHMGYTNSTPYIRHK